jgi:hypothetical protein
MQNLTAYNGCNYSGQPADFMSFAKKRMMTDTKRASNLKVQVHEQQVQDEADDARQYDRFPPFFVYQCRHRDRNHKDREMGCSCKQEDSIHSFMI